jgi:Ca2+-binding RTX toxin-like protein
VGIGRVGSEILVNTATAGAQRVPQLTALSDGGFVVAWDDDSRSGGDTTFNAARAQVFDAAGTPVGGEILANTTTADRQQQPEVTALPNGGFVLVWNDYSKTGGDTSEYAIRAQVFGATGAPVGGEILVNTATWQSQVTPQITTLSGGGFVATWRDGSATAPDTTLDAVRAQVFAPDGTRVGGEILVNTITAGNQREAQITALSGGGFAVTWLDSSMLGGDFSNYAVRAQVFGATGTRVGSEILVNTATANGQVGPQIAALSNGGFAVTWEDNSHGAGGATGDSNGSAVKAQAFDATGTAVGTEILVNTATANDQREQQITGLTGGGFVVTWKDDSQSGGDTSGAAVRAQVFGAAGAKVGGEILVNTTTAGSQQVPHIAALPDGGFVISWQDLSQSGGDTSGSAVRAQVFTATGARVGGEILVNTTTAGDQGDLSEHQVTALPGGFVIAWGDDSRMGGDTSGYAIRAQVFAFNNDAPAGANAALAATAGSPKVLAAADFGFTDVNGDDLTAVRIATLPSGGSLTNDGVAVSAGQSVSAADIAAGHLAFTPSAGGTTSFTFQVRDDGGTANGGVDLDATPKTLTFNVSAAPPAPVTPPTQGGAGDDVVTLSGTPDTYAGGAGNDWIWGGDSHDTLQGNAGSDEIHGFDGNDILHGGKDDDQVLGEDGADLVFGDLGNDLVHGGAGNDLCEGGEGADTVRGGQGNDQVLGGAGADWLSGDKGDDTLTGGTGADIFHSFSGASLDRITDFSRAEGDRIQLDPGTTYSTAQVGADTVITLGGGGQVMLAGVQLSALGDGWLFGA